MNHQLLYVQHLSYPTTPAMNLYSQHVVGEVAPVYSQQKSTHGQLDGNLHLDEHLPWMDSKIIFKQANLETHNN